MAKISLHLDKRRTRKDQKFPLAIRINHQMSNRLILLKLFITEDQWNKKSQEIRRIQNSVRHTAAIQNKLAIAKNYIAANEKKVDLMNINELKAEIEFLLFKKEDEPEQNSGYLKDYGKSIIERTLQTGKLKTANWYQDSINSIVTFNKGKDIRLQEIDVTFLEKYKSHYLNKGLSKNSISARLRALRALMNKAQKEGEEFLSKSHKPFEDFSIPTQKTAKRAVSKDVINALRVFPLEQFSNPWHNRNYFLFMFNMQGMNFVDLAKLKVSQISKGRLHYIRSKTNRPYDLKLTKESEEILEHYLPNKKSSDFVFPILTKEIGHDPILVSKTCDQFLHVFNNNLRKLAKKCGIEQKITSYVARHSWASAARKLGVSTDVIGDALGHNNYSTTEVYLQEFDTDRLDEVNLLVTS